MRKVNKYYKERLGSDARLNPYIMEYLSLCELSLTYADQIYQSVIDKVAVGDAGELRLNYAKKDVGVFYEDENKNTIETEIPLGVYEGYLMAGLKPDQIIRDHTRYKELEEIPKGERTKKQQHELDTLGRWYDLACDFASANRYLLEKDEFDEKDIRYAFKELPEKEFAVEKGKVRGEMYSDRKPSTVYQGVIFEKLFGGFRALKLDDLGDNQAILKVLDDYMTGCCQKNPDLAGKILKYYAASNKDNLELLFQDFFNDIISGCMEPAYYDSKKMDGTFFGTLIVPFIDNSKFMKWFEKEVKTIRNGGGEA